MVDNHSFESTENFEDDDKPITILERSESSEEITNSTKSQNIAKVSTISSNNYRNSSEINHIEQKNNEKFNTIEHTSTEGTNPKYDTTYEEFDSKRIIKEIEIMKSVYDTWYFHALLLFGAFICSYGYSLDSRVRRVYKTYAASSYKKHSLVSTINVIDSVASATSQVVYSRASDIFGRLSLLLVAIICYVVGTIIQSQAYDIQRYCAGSFFYNLGYVGVSLLMTLILSDYSSLKWRFFYQAILAWPNIINDWISGIIVDRANPIKHWSWDIGMWAFIFPLSCIPILCCLIHMQWLASQTDEWKQLKKGKSYFKYYGYKDSLIDMFWRFDVVGVILLAAFIGLILIPLTLAGGTKSRWSEGKLIAPFVIGCVMVPCFAIWEKWFAKHPIMPWRLIKDRSIWAALTLSLVYKFVFAVAQDYMYSLLLVAVDESIKSATTIGLIHSFVSSVGSPFFSYGTTFVGRLKPFIFLGTLLYMLSLGLLYYYRGGKWAHSGIIGALCVVGGLQLLFFITPLTVITQASVSSADMANVTALILTFDNIGTGIGAAVSGAIWTQTLYKELFKRMKNKTLAKKAYSSPLSFIANYSWGTPVRNIMVESYRSVQRYEIIVAISFCAPLVLLTFALRDINLNRSTDADLEDGKHVKMTDSDPIFDFFANIFNKIFHSSPRGKKSDNSDQDNYSSNNDIHYINEEGIECKNNDKNNYIVENQYYNNSEYPMEDQRNQVFFSEDKER
ncbi:hypothetical protein TBLA_0F00470 [Henningerozyma blattae CBS 6284]|uniref:Major facilitator superfamily (MFS) profile domain-containing protein n=1 Tax=Henningerozyma blattae (strain ATCC 34711 / CBS 6284 / DSM 70876 / NBRC 10599 / NRRL Y-10934 / UCD 77-7) TaxID=1071380 RepID=I2H5D9_HENB6|nr:hypothetical protein TBLA_0F00470 [Tetrapisispora blattae CBS 6284]CCH61591.1 hypothetical protein TBLA_0F00470 [Tetrapisispora blattae CBS 6284]